MKPRMLVMVSILGGLAVFAFGQTYVGPLLALVAAGVAVPLLHRFFSNLEPAEIGRRRDLLGDQLPMALELISAAVKSGAPVVQALELVCNAIEDPLREELTRVAKHLRLGAESQEAWGGLLDPERVGAEVASATRAVLRAGRTGARLAPALLRIATDTRAEASARAIERAHKAGVMSALPLGLCFLPAFVVLGVVPIVVTTLTKVL